MVEEEKRPEENPDQDTRDRFRRLTTEGGEPEPQDWWTPPAPAGSAEDNTRGETPPAKEQPVKPVGPSRAETIPMRPRVENAPVEPGDTAPRRTFGTPGGGGTTRPAARPPAAGEPIRANSGAETRPSGDNIPTGPRAGGPVLPPPPPGGWKPSPTGSPPSLPPQRQPPPGYPPAGNVRPGGYTPPPPQGGTPRRSRRGRDNPLPQVDFRTGLGCLMRMSMLALFVIVTVVLCGLSFVFFQYYRIAATLPDINDLRTRASQFETTRILDRNGNPLYEILDPTAGRRTYVPLDQISPYLVAATIATEDKNFYSNPGVDVIGIVRAFWQNYQGGEVVSGASTITQQLSRALLFSPEERSEQTYGRKIREAVLATEITRRYSKDEILELYLNEIYFGNLAYGVEAASETYFGTTADQLTLGQAAFLAGLPQAPSVYDVYNNPELAFRRMEDVLVLMYETSQEQGCIHVSNHPQRICLDPVAVTNAVDEIRGYTFRDPDVQIRYPHWVTFVRSLLESQFDAQTIYRSGFTVYTTLDPALQDAAQQTVQSQVASLADRNATDGALVAVRPATGEILAMVGSADFYNEAISGQVNMAISPRQPGSAIKPLTYAAAFEKGWTPATLLWDVPSEFPPSGRPEDPRPPYEPVNYDDRFHGPVTLRTALANSYNIPAVKALDFVGIYDDPETPEPDGLVSFARRMGISTLTRDDYGLSLTLGGGDVTLLELTNAYATFANNGRRIPPVAITRILDRQGNVVYEYQIPPGEQVVRPEHAYLITSILSDNQARIPAFGTSSALNLPFPAAVKTGTTNDVRDNWTLGYTPEVAVGVWVGNADYTPMNNTSGLTGAAPIWNQFMQVAVQQLAGGSPRDFSRPPGVVEYVICALSGTQPSQWCPQQTNELFAADQPPLAKEEDLWQRAFVDTWTGLRASEACSDFTDEQFVLNVSDPWARQWLRQSSQGQAWAAEIGFEPPYNFAPNRECRADDPRPQLEFVSPQDGDTIREGPLRIAAVVNATQWFDSYRLEYGLGTDPVDWTLMDGSRRPANGETIFEWDLQELVGRTVPPGPLTLRLTMESTEGTFVERKITINIQVPTPTPSPTPTEVPTATPTQTPLPTDTPTITPTPTPSPTPAPTKAPKATLTFTPSPTSGRPLPTAVITLPGP